MNVITLGSFDCFHRGHMALLKKCMIISEYGRVVVGLNTDEFYKKYRGYKPVMSYEEREKIIEEFMPSAVVLPNDQPDGTAKQIILDSRADIIVIGSDWGRKDYLKQLGVDWDWLDEHKIGVAFVTYTKDISSTEIKRRIGENLTDNSNPKS